MSSRASEWVPSDELSQLFFQGRYDTVLERAAASPRSDDIHPAILGALAMVGRLEEAEAIAALPGSAQATQAAMIQFVLCMGQCHAGRHDDAVKTAARLLRATRSGSALERFFARQAAAMTRYFTGRMRLAKQHALTALAYSWRTGLDYARLIALELDGHASAQLGELSKGLRALEDARTLARSLGYLANAQTIRLSALTYALRTAEQRRDALAELSALLERDAVSDFARRNGLLSLALDHAVAGRLSTASALWEQARLLALRNEDLRGSERATTIRALLASLAGDRERADELWREADGRARDDARSTAEVCYLAAVVGRPVDRARLERIAASTGLHRARVALCLDRGDSGATWLDWPAVGLFPRSRDRLLDHLEGLDALGLLPRSLGLPPGRRLYLAGERWVVEDRGDLAIVEPVRHATELIEEIAGEARAKGSIFQTIWKQSYNPRLHDATLHKLVSRCRKLLGDQGHWIESTEGGYQLADGVEVFYLEGAELRRRESSASEPEDRSSAAPIMRQLGDFTSTDLAQRLRVSKATAVRLIRREMEDGRLEKRGSGKNTCYRVVDDAP